MVRRSNATGSGMVIIAVILAAVILAPNLFQLVQEPSGAGLDVASVGPVSYSFDGVREDAILVWGIVQPGFDEKVFASGDYSGGEIKDFRLRTQMRQFDEIYELKNQDEIIYDDYIDFTEEFSLNLGGFIAKCEASDGEFRQLYETVFGLGRSINVCVQKRGISFADIADPTVDYSIDVTLSYEKGTKTEQFTGDQVKFFIGGEQVASIDNTNVPGVSGNPNLEAVTETGGQWVSVGKGSKRDLEIAIADLNAAIKEAQDAQNIAVGERANRIRIAIDKFERDLAIVKKEADFSVDGNKVNYDEGKGAFVYKHDPGAAPDVVGLRFYLKASEVLIESTVGEPEITNVDLGDGEFTNSFEKIAVTVKNVGQSEGSFTVTGNVDGAFFSTAIIPSLTAGNSQIVNVDVKAQCTDDRDMSGFIVATGGGKKGGTDKEPVSFKCLGSVQECFTAGEKSCGIDPDSMEQAIFECDGRFLNPIRVCTNGGECISNSTGYFCKGGDNEGGDDDEFPWEIILIVGGVALAAYFLTGKRGGGNVGSFQSFGGL